MRFQLSLPYHHTQQDLEQAVRRHLGHRADFRILKRSIDARQHRNIRVEYSLTTELEDPVRELRAQINGSAAALAPQTEVQRPLVVGSGPGGIFCAWWLHLHGFRPILLEQGPPMRERIRDMARFMKHGELHPRSNICFGAGGAGTYSDGKLITRIRSPYIPFVMQTFVDYGAPDDIRYLYNPHLGSNRIRQCMTRMLDDMQRRGIDIRYNTRFTGYVTGGNGNIIAVETEEGRIDGVDALFLATGHSARDVYTLLRAQDVAMSLKEFAVGVRVEHPATVVNSMQYGRHYAEKYPGIETAQYRLAKTWKEEQRAVYSFCMCPGGYVLNASSDTTGVVTNGMSNYRKSGRFSNAAIVVNVSTQDLSRAGYDGVDAGLQLQRELEEKFRAAVNSPSSSHVVPGQRLQDFLSGSASSSLGDSSCVNPVAPAPLHALFPQFVSDGLRRGFSTFDRKMRGFATGGQAQVFGIESRTSAPYRIERDATSLQSLTHANLYPVGEGAGYAGGITSAAIDGIRCAEAWLHSLSGIENPAGRTDENAK
ncbi:hypothetical protein KQI65_09015 [bacterium]|nr:hypothetical protein [bacterium]